MAVPFSGWIEGELGDIPFSNYLEFYLNAKDILSRDANDNIDVVFTNGTSIRAKSFTNGSDYDMQINLSGPIKFKIDSIGNPYLDFQEGAAGSGMISSQVMYAPVSLSGFTYYAVIKQPIGTTSSFIGGVKVPTSNTPPGTFYLYSNGNHAFYPKGVSGTAALSISATGSSNTPWPLGVDTHNWRVILVVCGGESNNSRVWSNGVKAYESQTVTPNLINVNFQGYHCINEHPFTTTSAAMKSDILEVGLYTKALTVEEIEYFYKVIKNKYNITSY